MVSICASMIVLMAPISSFASELHCKAVIEQPGNRSYVDSNGDAVVYEGSLFRSLVALSRIHGMGPVSLKTGHDVYLNKRLSSINTPTQIAETISKNVGGITVTNDENRFNIYQDQQSGIAFSSPCNSEVTFIVKADTLKSNLDTISSSYGVEFDYSGLSDMDKLRVQKPKVITGTSFLDVVAQLIADSNVEMSFLTK